MVAQRAQVAMIRGEAVQRQEREEQASSLQGASGEAVSDTPLQAKAEHAPNRTGMPDSLKAGIEHLSGLSMDHVKVHYNSRQPAQLNAAAYAMGSDIHVAPGEERHLPHEAWHVVQQARGLVKPTMQARGVRINDNESLEREADVMGARALQLKSAPATAQTDAVGTGTTSPTANVVQAKQFYEDNQHSGQDAGFYNHQLAALNAAMKAAVTALPDNANTAAAQTAMQAVFGGHPAVPAGHVLNFTGSAVFLDTAAGAHVDRLGTLADDQNQQMYLPVPAAAGDVNTLWVNKSTGAEYVRDANGLFTPRFQSRSITVADRQRVNGRNSIQGANPGSHATPLQHVGGAPSPYISMTAGLADVTNAQGALFNANSNGRVHADMLQVPAADIVDLHATAGATLELGNRMAVNIRNNFPAIWDAAHTEVAAIHAAQPGQAAAAHAAAGAHRPATMNAGQTQQWQQILDAVRTKEVLVHGNVPFDAITSFGNANGHALSAATNTAIAANLVRSQGRSAAAAATLGTHQQAAAIGPQLKHALLARKAHATRSFKVAARAAVAALPAGNRAARYNQFHNSMSNAIADLDALAHLFQQRISGGVYGADAAGIAAGVAAFIAQANADITATVNGT
ncbi:DUF4157 domain-containing protein [Trinickia terrae]|uniref:DUF4157 domain-containing protein n=2 Tax=Trinickia terrae TaxID=2571161 RepID=A0A4U1I1D7_9BURK|nr:DUF4157 domain-containing protein [Trinickia terrae]